MEFHMINIIYTLLSIYAHKKKKQHFHAKTTVYNDEAHTALDIFR